MESWPISGERLRAMYAGSQANATARRLARLWAAIFSLGLAPRRWVTLEVTGRRSGRATRFPLGMARLNGRWYLVSMLGERCNWVRNVRAADGHVTLRHGRATRCRLVELPVGDRPPVLRQYLRQVPGARPHVPVGRNADVAEFASIAPLYPVFLVQVAAAAERGTRRGAIGRLRLVRRWWQRILAGVVIAVVIVLAAVAAFIKLGPSAAALELPPGRVSTPAGPLSGAWQVSAGSLAGFRVQESALGLSNDVGGQTAAVTGLVVISRDTVTAATFRVNLTTLKVGGKSQPQFAASLDTREHPFATFTLTRPVTLGAGFTTGRAVAATAIGELAMNGRVRLVTVTLTARRNGPELQAAGSLQATFARWGISRPAGFGLFGSLANEGVAQFRLILHR